jgi:hypothetical protein
VTACSPGIPNSDVHIYLDWDNNSGITEKFRSRMCAMAPGNKGPRFATRTQLIFVKFARRVAVMMKKECVKLYVLSASKHANKYTKVLKMDGRYSFLIVDLVK